MIKKIILLIFISAAIIGADKYQSGDEKSRTSKDVVAVDAARFGGKIPRIKYPCAGNLS